MICQECDCCALVTAKYQPSDKPPVRGLTDRIHDYSGCGRTEKHDVHLNRVILYKHCRRETGLNEPWSIKPAADCFRGRRLPEGDGAFNRPNRFLQTNVDRLRLKPRRAGN